MKGRKRKIIGTKDRPRLSVYKSLKNIQAQVIDDQAGRTLAFASTLGEKNGGNVKAAAAVGKEIAARAQKAGIAQVVFDRGKKPFHGRIKALADAAREGGLKF